MIHLALQLTTHRLSSNRLRTLLFLAAIFSVFFIHLFIGGALLEETLVAGLDVWRQESPFDIFIYSVDGNELNLESLLSLASVREAVELQMRRVLALGMETRLLAFPDDVLLRVDLLEGFHPVKYDEVIIPHQLFNRPWQRVTIAFPGDTNERFMYYVSGVMGVNNGTPWGLFTTVAGVQRISSESQTVIGVKLANQLVDLRYAAETIRSTYPQTNLNIYSYLGLPLAAADGGLTLAGMILSIISGLIFFVAVILVFIFAYFNYREHLYESGVLLSLGMSEWWLSTVSMLAANLIITISLALLYISAPLISFMFNLGISSQFLNPLAFLSRMAPIYLTSVGIAIVFSFFSEDWSIARILRDDWTG